MTNIIDTFAAAAQGFVPNIPREYLAVQIARKLNDVQAVRHYSVLFEHYPEELLLSVFRQCRDENNLSGSAFMQKFRELTMQSTDERSTDCDHSFET